MNYKQQIGKTIKRLRTEQQLTQEDLAFISGLSLQSISDIESAKYDPTLNDLYRIAAVLEMKPSELVLEIEQETTFPKFSSQEI